MRRISTYVFAIAVSVGTTAMLATNGRTVTPSPIPEARLASDGAFRDGLYLGKLAAQGGKSPRPAVGRWSTDQDRSMFTAGYRRGYNDSLASANSESSQSTE